MMKKCVECGTVFRFNPPPKCPRCREQRTELNRLCDLLASLQVDYTVETSDTGTTVRCDHGRARVSGYLAFYTTFEFRPDGTFVEMGAWE